MAKDITVQELKKKMDQEEDFVLIDVREPHEHQDFNIGGELIPMGNFPAAMQELNDKKDKEIVVYCRSGRRSGTIKNLMQSSGFNQVRNLEGGMLAWQDAFEEK